MQTPFTGCGHALRHSQIFLYIRPGRGRSRLAAAACVLALAGCAPEYGDYGYAVSDSAIAAPKKPTTRRVPAPSQALLTPERKPDCEADAAIAETAQTAPARIARREREDASASASDVSDPQRPVAPPPPAAAADLALRIKLEYERECYKQAEGRVRARLQRLQAWTAETIKASSR